MEGVFESRLLLLHGALLSNEKTIWTQNKNAIQYHPFTHKKNKYTNKIVNAYIAYDLDNWPKRLPDNFKLIGVDRSLSSHIDNWKNIFLVLGQCRTDDINSRLGTPEQKLSINFSKAKTKFCLN